MYAGACVERPGKEGVCVYMYNIVCFYMFIISIHVYMYICICVHYVRLHRSGCELLVTGTPLVIYKANETPMVSYINLHGALEVERKKAKADSVSRTIQVNVNAQMHACMHVRT